MRQPSGSVTGLAIALCISVAVPGCMPAPPIDDNGELSYFRQAVPKLLGRKAKGGDEVKLLADLSGLVGRDAVVRMLMEQAEFGAYWTDVIVDNLRMQREGNRAQQTSCFGDPMRASVTGDLANFIRTNAPGSVAPGGAFNMIDVIASAIKLDDLSPIYRAYPVPLMRHGGFFTEEQKRLAIGDAFNHALLNHQIDCLGCHNSVFSTTNGGGWDRTFAIPLQLEAAVYGPNFFDPNETKAKTYGVFRGDQQSGPTTVNPWGITSSCGSMRTSLAGLPDIDSFFAGAAGNQLGLIDVLTKFKTGSDALKASGVSRTNVPGENPTLPGDQGYAFMVAATIAENVWDRVHGEKLTIANYYPRNPHQRGALWNLTEFALIPADYSLKELVARILKGRFFNRTAPDIGGGTSAYRLQMIFDPWVQKDPRLPDPMPDPKEHNNGQGELVHRYSPNSLFRSVSAALDWPGPKRFPTNAYPSATLVKGMGQYTSDAEQGSRGVDFQGLLIWESQHGVCQKPAGAGTDWVDRLITSIPVFDAANPGFPLTVADLVETMKDWFIGEQSIGAAAPTPTDPMSPILSEQAALFALFGVPLNTTAASVAGLQAKVRQLCGVLLQSPRFLLAGLEPTTGFAAPRHRVCNGTPCAYAEMCSVYRSTLAAMGHYVDCGTNAVFPGQPPLMGFELVCPRGDCFVLSSRAASFCERNPHACVVTLPPEFLDELQCGPRGCPQPWLDIRKPTMLVWQADGVPVAAAQGATIKSRDDKEFRAVKRGDTLRAGDVLRLPPGAALEAKTDVKTFATPKGGMPSKFTSNQSALDRELIGAVERGNTVLVEALLGKRISIDARDRFGETPLMKAATAGNVAIVQLLLKHGADPGLEDARGATAADFAALRKQGAVIELLSKRGLVAKNEGELARLPPRREEPWIVLVGSDKPPPVDPSRMTPAAAWELTERGVLGTKAKSIDEIQKAREQSKFSSRGQGGVLPRSPREAREAVKFYMEHGFAKEHPDHKGK